MILDKKYYIVHRGVDYITHGKGIIGHTEVNTNATVDQFDIESDLDLELLNYNVPKTEET